MKSVYIYLATLMLSFTACNTNTNTYTIAGKVNISHYPESKKVYLLSQRNEITTKLDSSIIEDGNFTFKGVSDSAQYGLVAITNAGEQSVKQVPFFLEAGDIRIIVDKNDTVVGSDLNDMLFDFESVTDSINYLLRNISDKSAWENTHSNYNAILKNTLFSNIDNLFGLMMIKGNFRNLTLEEKRRVLESVPAKYSKDPIIENARAEYNAIKIVSEGQHFADFELESIKGEKVKLSDYAGRGKYVLIDFWASWCGPCRREMPTIVEAYKRFKNDKFEIVGVSLDSSKEDWSKGIKELNITWPQMSDLKRWKSEASRLYRVRSIPHTILIDPQGIIIAKDLRGEELLNKLSELLEK